MVKPSQMAHLKQKLYRRRQEIFDSRGNLETARRELGRPEVEFEENAEKASLSLPMDHLADQEKQEIEAIDGALRRIDVGSHDVCTICGRDISFDRLNALPWTTMCNACARARKEGDRSGRGAESMQAEIPREYHGLSDVALRSVILDKIRTDGRVEQEELDISCHGGTVYLDGALPSEANRHILLEILRDEMGFEVVDRITVDPLLWERKEHPSHSGERKKTRDEIWMEGEDIEDDVFESRKTGEPLSPPDELIPEKEEI